jgi:hypothetical protein
MSDNAENQGARDFHVETNDANHENFQCPVVQRFDPGNGWVEVFTWPMAHESQDEGDKNRHYLSWYYRPTGGDPVPMERGDAFRFCFVYCGSAKRDGTAEWILTDSGDVLPAVPVDGDREDVPNVGNPPGDDPGWYGQSSVNDGAGFALTGACCPGDGRCLEIDLETCELEGGDFAGEGTSCVSHPCGSVPTRSSSWGEIKNTFRGDR